MRSPIRARLPVTVIPDEGRFAAFKYRNALFSALSGSLPITTLLLPTTGLMLLRCFSALLGSSPIATATHYTEHGKIVETVSLTATARNAITSRRIVRYHCHPFHNLHMSIVPRYANGIANVTEIRDIARRWAIKVVIGQSLCEKQRRGTFRGISAATTVLKEVFQPVTSIELSLDLPPESFSHRLSWFDPGVHSTLRKSLFAVAVCRLLFIRVGVVDLYALPSTPHMHVASLHVVHQRS